MRNHVLAACLILAIGRCTSLLGDEPSRLEVGICAWLQRQPKDDDSWKGRRAFPHSAVISNASADPKLSEFVTKIGRFTMSPLGEWPGRSGDYLESMVIENTNFTVEQARHIEKIWTRKLTISSCEISNEVAKSLGSIRTLQRSQGGVALCPGLFC